MTIQTFVPTFPLFPTLADAITKTRLLTASSNLFQTTDTYIVTQMNSFYSYDLPAKFRSLKLKDIYTFTTNVGQDVYPFNSELYTTVDNPCYCAKREIKLYNDPWSFYGVNFNWQNQENFSVGSAIIGAGPYLGNTIGFPISPSVNNDPGPQTNPSLYFTQGRVQNILITANAFGPNGVGQTQSVTDDGQGNLIQIFQTSNSTNQEYGWTYYRQYASSTPLTAGNATINYQTGVITGLTFALPIPAGTPITIQYNSRKPSIPLAIMFYQNQFTLAPMPNAGYTIELTAYRSPIKALLAQNQSGNPELSEWWEILAVGAAKKIFENRLDTDGIAIMDKMLRERYDIIETRTCATIGQRSIYTIYTDQLTQNYGQNGFGAYFGGP
jgi:hypothetical protein